MSAMLTVSSYGRPMEWDRPLYFHPMVSFSIFFCFPHLISAVADWMSGILAHMVWPLCQFKMQL